MMGAGTLESAVFNFAKLTWNLPDHELDREWVWGDYDEGVRFAFFRNYEDLCTLAARLEAERKEPFSEGQRILAQLQAAYRDLQAILSGVDDASAIQEPAKDEWPLHRVLAHIVQAERTFFAIVLYTLERQRSGDGRPLEMSDKAYEAFWTGDPFEQIKEKGSFSELLAYYDILHSRVLESFSTVTDDELQLPVVFWESTPMPVRFRLHRFNSHLRQHTIQAQKTLDMLARRPNEARRLLRLIFNALAKVEGARLGNTGIGEEQCQAIAEQINQRTHEIEQVLSE